MCGFFVLFCFSLRFYVCAKVVGWLVAFVVASNSEQWITNKFPFPSRIVHLVCVYVCKCIQLNCVPFVFRILFRSDLFIYFSPGAANICCLLLAFHFGLLLLFSECRFSLSHTFAFRQQMNVKTGGIKKTRVSSELPTNSFHITWIKPYHWHRIFIHQTWISNYFLPTIADSFRDSMIYTVSFHLFLSFFLFGCCVSWLNRDFKDERHYCFVSLNCSCAYWYSSHGVTWYH